MYSQTSHIFSQNGELSQITPYSGNLNQSQEVTNENEQLRNEIEYPQDFDSQSSRQEYIQNATEEPLSSRASAICEENRKKRHFLESNLKKMEKKRLKLKENLNELYVEFTSNWEMHQKQSQQVIQLQMAHEECTERYNYEIRQRSSLLQKMKDNQGYVEYFLNKYAEGMKFIEEIKNDLSVLSSGLVVTELQTINEEKNKMIQSCKTEFEQLLQQAKQLKNKIHHEREKNITKIKSLALKHDKLSYNNNKNEEKMNYLIQNVEAMTYSCDKLETENKFYNDEITKLQQQLYEDRTSHTLHIQNLKLQINTEENKNSALESKVKEAENSLNIQNTKVINNTNFRDQLTLSIEESTKRRQIQDKEIEEYNEKIECLTQENGHLVEELKKYENVNDINEDLKRKISALEETNKINDIYIKEKEEKVLLLSNEIKEKTQNESDIEDKLAKLNEEYEESVKIRDELVLKVNTDLASYEDERKSKTSQNTTMQQTNDDLTSKIDQMSKQLNERQEHNISLNKTVDELKESIESHKQRIKQKEIQMISTKEDWEVAVKTLNENLNSLQKEYEYYEDLLIEMKPKLDELPGLQKIKLALEQEIHEAEDNFKKEKENLESNFNAKILDMDREQEKYSSIVESLLLAEEEATEKLKVEIKETEKTKAIQENKIKSLQKQLHSLKLCEMSKRQKIVNIEKRLRTINKEMTVTRQDISDAITGKSQPTKRPHKPIYDRNTKVTRRDGDLSAKSQITTNKWMKTASVDEYEYSDF